MSSTPVYSHFPPRAQCLDPECQGCGGFIYQPSNSRIYSQEPHHPKCKCLCGHYYLVHYHVPQPDPHNPFPLRGPNCALGCGGFFKMHQVQEFDPREQCDYCHATWLSHDNVVSLTPHAAAGHSAAPVAAPSFTTAALIPAHHPPTSDPSTLALSKNPFHSNPSPPNTLFLPLAGRLDVNPFGMRHSAEPVDPPPPTVSDHSNPFARTSLPPPAAAFKDVHQPIPRFQPRFNSTESVQTLRKQSITRMNSDLKGSSPRRSRSINPSGFSGTGSSTPLQDSGPLTDAVPPPPGHQAYKILCLPFKVIHLTPTRALILTCSFN
ncbi:hypothetical protein C8R45DRAFT_1115939 [Mycena sanguinolenta]|nr:hypothetical protein C8R45DRAFT_1115939 [Mycena sanguinolenta]